MPTDIPLPPKLLEGQALKRQQSVEQSTLGWWSFHGLSGALPRVLETIQQSKIPDHWKAALVADVTQRCGTDFNYVTLDAHYIIHGGRGTIHVSTVCEKKLL